MSKIIDYIVYRLCPLIAWDSGNIDVYSPLLTIMMRKSHLGIGKIRSVCINELYILSIILTFGLLLCSHKQHNRLVFKQL